MSRAQGLLGQTTVRKYEIETEPHKRRKLAQAVPFNKRTIRRLTMPTRRLRDFLDGHKIRYKVINHSSAYSALEAAQSAHISGREIAKTVILKFENTTVMAVLPASSRINFEFFKALYDTQYVRLATEDEIRIMFPDCEIGAMPPFGNLYSIDVCVAQQLTEDDEIAFNAGNFHQLLQMKYTDFERLVRPIVLDFALEASELEGRSL